MQRSEYIKHVAVDSLFVSPRASTYRRVGYPDDVRLPPSTQVNTGDSQHKWIDELNDIENQAATLHALCLQGTVDEIKNFFNTTKDDNENETDHSSKDGYYYVRLAIFKKSSSHSSAMQKHFVGSLCGLRSDVLPVIDVLMENGVDVNATTYSDSSTALHLVVENGEFPSAFRVVIRLLELQADVTIRNRSLRTPYDCALGMGYDRVAATLDGTMTPQEAKEYYRKHITQLYSPYLIEAVMESDEEGIKKNIRLGADPNVLNKYGAGAIHYAITHCDLPVLTTLEYLRDGGADVNLRDDEGDTALNLAIKVDRFKEADLRPRVVSKLLEWGADQTYRDLDGKDALQLATERGYSEIVALLGHRPIRYPSPVRRPLPVRHPSPVIPAEPEPEVEDNAPEPETVVEAVDAVDAVDADPEPESEVDTGNADPEPEPYENNEDVSVHDGSQSEEDDVNTPNEDGLYPLHEAVLIEDPEERKNAIATLFTRGADVNVTVKRTGVTALHMASQRNQPATVEQLLERGAFLKKKNKLGNTAYDIAKSNSHTEVMRVLKDWESKRARENWDRARQQTSFCLIS
ncbi:ankyrin-1-like [Gigantopelta aegis]|uniref:ankyrin-1-like n=1 Tax=Gigantopelta aegis TaxID=1735272 RepID=UPI001B88D1FE|nr:ankyrin-1-like [Gigantopelta aegis]